MEPNQSDLAAWIAKYGNVHTREYEGDTFVYRALTYKELKHLSAAAQIWNRVDLEDYIIAQAVLFPDQETLEDASAGFISTLADEIRDESGLGDAKRAINVLNEARQEAQNVINFAKIYILATMPAYREEDLNDFTTPQLFHLVALAEQIIELNQTAMAGNSIQFTIIDPEQQAAEEAKAKEKERKKMEDFVKKGGHVDPNAAPPIKPKIDVAKDPIAQKLLGLR